MRYHITLLSPLTAPVNDVVFVFFFIARTAPNRTEPQAIHDPIETDDTWITGRSCESISAENSSVEENDETDYDTRKIACGMVAQVPFLFSFCK